MIRMRLTTERAKRFIASSLIIKNNKPVIDKVVAKVTPKGIIVADLSLASLGVYALFPKTYFIEYAVDETVLFPLTVTLHKALKSFKIDAVEIVISDGTVRIIGGNKEYSEGLELAEEPVFSIKMIKTDLGLIPEKAENSPVILKIVASDLAELPKADFYRFISDGNSLIVEVENVGKFSVKLNPIAKIKLEKLKVRFDGDALMRMIANMKGEITLILSESAMVLSERTKDFMITYLMSAIAETEELEEKVAEETAEAEEKVEEETEEEEFEDLL